MTEDEAREKLCPINSIHARIVGGMMAAEGVKNEEILIKNLSNIFCKASDCMMWKWIDNRETDGYGRKQNKTGRCGLVK